jgi:CRISPR-associated endoribonuclease Cas6
MRLLLKLKARKSVKQNKENNSKFYTGLHGWIYDKLKETDFSEIHSKTGFKPFCFSNLFPIKGQVINEEEIYSLIISSPNEMFVIAILSKMNISEVVNLGEYSFELISYKPLTRKEIAQENILENETIINICILKDDKKNSITFSKSPELFKANLAKNLVRKYNQFNNPKIGEGFDLWKNIEIEEIKGTESAIKINLIKESDNWFNVIGARYQFKIGEIDETQKKILNLCYDLGFGERNSFGFGFMNLKPHKEGKNG